jgi:hypothetical protein
MLFYLGPRVHRFSIYVSDPQDAAVLRWLHITGCILIVWTDGTITNGMKDETNHGMNKWGGVAEWIKNLTLFYPPPAGLIKSEQYL